MARTNLNSRGMTRPADIGGDVLSLVSAEKRIYTELLKKVRMFDDGYQPKSFSRWLSSESKQSILEMKELCWSQEHADEMAESHDCEMAKTDHIGLQ